MAKLLQHLISSPDTCSYLPDRNSVMESKIMVDVTPEELETLLDHGWRRFGPTYFRPACQGCAECVSLRIPVAAFSPNRAQRRARRNAAGLRMEVGVPHVTRARLALYKAWHATREDARGWSKDTLDHEQYELQFCFPHPAARELAFYDGSHLMGVGIVDETPQCLSAVYFFFDPAYQRLSPGVVNVLTQIDLAKQTGKEHLYLGFRVLGCASLKYKGTFHPHELLVGRPSLEETAVWAPAPKET